MLQADATKRLQRIIGQHHTLRDVFSPPPVKQAGLIREMVTGSVRFYPTLSFFLSNLLKKPLAEDHIVHSLLVLGVYQLWKLNIPVQVSVNETVAACRHLKQDWASGLVNAVLRNFLRQQKVLVATSKKDIAANSAHPEWLLKQIQQDWPNDWQTIIEANNTPAAPCLRINTQKITVSDYQASLQKQGIEAQTLSMAPQALLLPNSVDITALPGYAEGWFYVQDAAAQLAIPLLNLAPGQRVLDACAAPGGKTTQLFEIEPDLSEVVAIDNSAQRIHLLKSNIKRMQLNKAPIRIITKQAQSTGDWWDGKSFDRIVLDAPCSATGVIRRQPDVKLHRSSDQVVKATRLQLRLLESLWRCLAPGGMLAYITCSILQAEGPDVVNTFTQQTKNAKLLPNQLYEGQQQWLPSAQHDGFFIALLEKTP